MIENCTMDINQYRKESHDLTKVKYNHRETEERGGGKVRAWTAHWKASPGLRRARVPGQHRSPGCTTEIFS